MSWITQTLSSRFDEIVNGAARLLLRSDKVKVADFSSDAIETQAELILNILIESLAEDSVRKSGSWLAVSQVFPASSDLNQIPNTPDAVKRSIWIMLEESVELGENSLADVVREMMVVESLLEDCWVTIVNKNWKRSNGNNSNDTRRIGELQSLTEILARESDCNLTYRAIAEKIASITEIPRCTLLVFNDRGVLEPVAASIDSAKVKLGTLSSAELISLSDLASFGKPAVVGPGEIITPEIKNVLENYEAYSLLLVPMKSSEDYIGLVVLDYYGPGEFAREQINLAVACANQAALSIIKSRLMIRMESSLKHMAAVGVIARTMTSKLDEEEQLRLLIEMAMRLIHADSGGIYLLDENTGEFVEKALTGESVWHTGESLQKVARWVCDYGEPIVLLKDLEDPRFGEISLQKEAVAIAPFLIRGKAIGMINLATGKKNERYGKEDLELFRNFAAQAAVSIENTQLYERLQDAYLGAISSLVAAIEARDPYTVGHSTRVTKYTVAIAREFGFSTQEVEEIRLAGLLHDVGKIGIPDKILNKPGPLSEEEYSAIKMHPTLSVRIVEPLPHLGNIIPMIYHHHERYDGKGYIEGMTGTEIPVGARILAVADAFEAMTSDRPYREALSRGEAIKELIEGAGSQFDPKVVETFIRLLKKQAYAV
ncbi:MAG: HD domain-containing protein [Actinobacteria bacterium]|nr:HD domain-containing protein [Actinomycetota bacterium]